MIAGRLCVTSVSKTENEVVENRALGRNHLHELGRLRHHDAITGGTDHRDDHDERASVRLPDCRHR